MVIETQSNKRKVVSKLRLDAAKLYFKTTNKIIQNVENDIPWFLNPIQSWNIDNIQNNVAIETPEPKYRILRSSCLPVNLMIVKGFS